MVEEKNIKSRPSRESRTNDASSRDASPERLRRQPAASSRPITRPAVVQANPVPPPEPYRYFRAEGLGRKGVIRFVRVMGVPGQWIITGTNSLRVEVGGRTVQEALRIARRHIRFRVVVVREMASLAELRAKPF